MIKKRLARLIALGALAVIVAVPSTAEAAESAFRIYVPAVGTVYTDTVSLSRSSTQRLFYLSDPLRRLGVQYKYGAGKGMAFQGVTPISHADWEPVQVLYPSGYGAPTKTLCDMYPGTLRGTVAASLNSVLGVFVEVLAQGDWVYNY